MIPYLPTLGNISSKWINGVYYQKEILGVQYWQKPSFLTIQVRDQVQKPSFRTIYKARCVKKSRTLHIQ